ncbi:cold-shock protein [Mesorhizobium sp. B1-1-9]|uniref:cold-shock protein n=1 Tax=Mesorhizobium sp. B1-1-9 TaxID=2589975 RepID=UPI001128D5B6|nr:cold shock domain-containing protein [Mesorhizobium sp. B1-1-9]TPN45311.1 cold-shock protein [Mesorhizobium sp. B1-1-9]
MTFNRDGSDFPARDERSRSYLAPVTHLSRTGQVVRWKTTEGYGFIRRDDGADVFAHASQIVGSVRELSAGQYVSFEIGISDRTGKSEARNIRLAN